MQTYYPGSAVNGPHVPAHQLCPALATRGQSVLGESGINFTAKTFLAKRGRTMTVRHQSLARTEHYSAVRPDFINEKRFRTALPVDR